MKMLFLAFALLVGCQQTKIADVIVSVEEPSNITTLDVWYAPGYERSIPTFDGMTPWIKGPIDIAPEDTTTIDSAYFPMSYLDSIVDYETGAKDTGGHMGEWSFFTHVDTVEKNVLGATSNWCSVQSLPTTLYVSVADTTSTLSCGSVTPVAADTTLDNDTSYTPEP